MFKADTKQKSRMLRLIGLLVLLACVATILLSGVTRLSEQYVRQTLVQLNDRLASEASRYGRKARLSYGDVRMEGWGYNKQAVVDNVRVELAFPGEHGGVQQSFSTAKMTITPDLSGQNRLTLVFADPLQLSEDGRLRAAISFAQPLRYLYSEAEENGQRVVAHQVVFPPEIILEEMAASATQPSVRTVIAYEHPSLQMRVWPESSESETTYGFSNIRLSGEGGPEVTIAALSGQHHERQPDMLSTEGKYMFNLSDMVQHNADKAGAPYSVAADVSYKGAKADADALNWDSMQMAINKFSLLSDEFKIRASGDVEIRPDDPMPSGNVDVNIENADRLAASEMVPEFMRPVVSNALEKIAGGPVSEKSNLSILLKREKNGVFFIGNTTFEALAATVFGDMMKAMNGAQGASPAAGGEEGSESLASPTTTQLPGMAPEPPAPAEPAKE